LGIDFLLERGMHVRPMDRTFALPHLFSRSPRRGIEFIFGVPDDLKEVLPAAERRLHHFVPVVAHRVLNTISHADEFWSCVSEGGEEIYRGNAGAQQVAFLQRFHKVVKISGIADYWKKVSAVFPKLEP